MCFVRDLNSTNGTYVNDVKITEESLKAGDEMLIGTTILVFVDQAPTTSKGDGVEFEGEENGKIESTTVELKVDSKGTRAIGKEVQSRNLTLISQLGRILRGERDFQVAQEKTVEILCRPSARTRVPLHRTERRRSPRIVVETRTRRRPQGERTIVNR
jgi:pSer/pThr/pTyr-binding forkhead associated (FHA) protein